MRRHHAIKLANHADTDLHRPPLLALDQEFLFALCQHHIDTAVLDPCQTDGAINRVLNSKTLPLEPTLDQPREIWIVVDVE